MKDIVEDTISRNKKFQQERMLRLTRLKELALQAKQSALDAMIKITDKEEALKVYSETYDTKFAELLVLECVTAVMDGTKEGDHYAMRIEKHFDDGPGGILHFGVEE